jgi:7-cyano-7-deazaguanine tRNA-ribosyltransferase
VTSLTSDLELERQAWTSLAGQTYRLPLFLPVYQPRAKVFQLAAWQQHPPIEGTIVNAFFLYKQRDIRKLLERTRSLKEFIGFHGLVATDSGAFQGFTRQLFLTNRDIVRFQNAIGSDVIAPLDLVTPPGDRRTIAAEKLEATEKRIIEGLRIVDRGVLAGVQQGGRFLDLRHRSVSRLMEIGVRYLAIGSLVPFFTANHDLSFVGKVIRDARAVCGPHIPIHVYGAGDPSELPFMFAMGADIFDSASYGHFAEGGWYMTPYGALKEPGPILAGEYTCSCGTCTSQPIATVFANKDELAKHNLWTICSTVDRLRSFDRATSQLGAYLANVVEIHQHWFPHSALRATWLDLND